MTGNDRLASFTRPFRTIFDVGAVAGLTDGELLERFAHRQGESAELAFAALLERHGPMVLRVCRKVLGDRHDTLDAFQATFLVLVQKAGSIRQSDSIASWLHGVAYRVALCDRSSRARRQKHEQEAVGDPGSLTPPVEPDDLGPILHQELGRLPDRYRAPLILCHLEGLTHEQAAERLNCPVGTIKSRMARGRARLKARLKARGFATANGLETQSLLIPPRITMDATARAATRLAAGHSMVGTVPPSTIALMQGVRKAMTLQKIKWTLSTMFALGVVATAACVLAQQPEPVPSPKPISPPRSGIVYETSFVEMTGLGWRADFHSRIRPLARKGSYTVWAVDGPTWKAIANRGKVVVAPKVNAFIDAKATISHDTRTKILAGFKEGGTPDDRSKAGLDAENLLLLRKVKKKLSTNELKHEAGLPIIVPFRTWDFQEIPDGSSLQISGHPVDLGILIHALVESDEIASIQSVPIRETLAVSDDSTIEGDFMIEIPEIIHARYEGEWLVRPGETLVIGLGIHRTEKKDKPSKTIERLIAFKAAEIPISPEATDPKPTPAP